MNHKNILITGSRGFLGSSFIDKFPGLKIIKFSLQNDSIENSNFTNISTIIHFAGLAHQTKNVSDSEYHRVNYELTKELADKAKNDGVDHFIFLSSFSVYGNPPPKTIITENSSCYPTNAYGKSKLEAEKYLKSIGDDAFKVSIIRPPMVYGPKAKGNPIKLMELASKKIFVPFKNIENKRSLVFSENLLFFVKKITDSKTEGTFICCDPKPISTSNLYSQICSGLAIPLRWFKLPKLGLFTMKKLVPGKYTSLYGDFEADPTESYKKLNYSVPFSTEEGLKTMCDWYKNEKL